MKKDRPLHAALDALDKTYTRLRQEHVALVAERQRDEARIEAIDAALAHARAIPCTDAFEELRFRRDYAHQVRAADRNKAAIRERILKLESERLAPVSAELAAVSVKKRAIERLLERRAEERRREADRKEMATMDEAGVRNFLARR